MSETPLQGNETGRERPAHRTNPAGNLVIGVLALQGDFHAHGRRLDQLGVPWRRVRLPADLDGVAGLILPGGESTTLLRLLGSSGLDRAILEFYRSGGVLFGTCAGLILLAREVLNPRQPSLGLLDVSVERNAYGRQIDSFETRGKWAPPDQVPQDIEMVFIRAPRIRRVGESARAIAWHNDEVVAVLGDRVLGATFHPELGIETTVHRYFLEMCGVTACCV